jgi:hypothetical protein
MYLNQGHEIMEHVDMSVCRGHWTPMSEPLRRVSVSNYCALRCNVPANQVLRVRQDFMQLRFSASRQSEAKILHTIPQLLQVQC